MTRTKNDRPTISLSEFYSVMMDMYGVDDLSGSEAIEAAKIARFFDQDYAIKNETFYLLSDRDLDWTNIRMIFRYIFDVETVRKQYDFSPVSFGHFMASVMDKLQVDYKMVHTTDDEVNIALV